jgi:hypothetical protein
MSAAIHRLLRGAVVAAAVVWTAAVTSAAGAGPFAGFNGVWTGGGHIVFADGTKERIRCRATYVEGGGGTALQQSLRCASDSYNFELRSDVESQGSQIHGNWNEMTRNIGGTLSGHARAGRIEVRIDNPSFNADLTLVARQNEQTVTIRSAGSQFSGATISLRRSARSVTDQERLPPATDGVR